MGLKSKDGQRAGGGRVGLRRKDNARDWTLCPDCDSRIKRKNFARHMINVHGRKAEEHGGSVEEREKGRMDGSEERGAFDKGENASRFDSGRALEVLMVFIGVIAIIAVIYFFIIPTEGGDTEDEGLSWEGVEDPVTDDSTQLTQYKQDVMTLSGADADPTTFQVPEQPTEYPPHELKAPGFTMMTVDDKVVSLEDLKGKVVVLDLMATWCGPCKLEMAHLEDVYSYFGDGSIEIVSIDVDSTETREQLEAFRNEFGGTDPWMFTLDPEGFIGSHIQTPAIPTIVIIDREGYISYSQRGVTDSEVLKGQIYKLV